MNEEAISLRQCLNFGVFKPHLFAVDILGIRALDLLSNLHLSLQNIAFGCYDEGNSSESFPPNG